jgi:hypothetical protein
VKNHPKRNDPLWMTAKNGVAPGKKARRNGSTTMAASAVG